MARIGEVIKSSIMADTEGEGGILFLQVLVSDVDDIQDVELMRHAGVDYRPPADSQAAIIDISSSYRVAVAVDDGIESEADEGDYEIYGSSGGAKVSRVKCTNDGQVELNGTGGATVSRVKCTNDGQVELNGTGDWAVRYDELEAAFNELKADFNALVGDYNSHQHLYVAPTEATMGDPTETITTNPPGTSPNANGPNGVVSTADMSPAKVETVELPDYEAS